MSSKRTRARNWRNDWPPYPWFYDSLFLAGQADCSPGENSVCGIFLRDVTHGVRAIPPAPSNGLQLGGQSCAGTEQGLVSPDDGKSLREEGLGQWQ